MANSIWLIIPQTNLHVGNESVVNFTVIDKAIQRDVTTGIPCINSSSLKGAIKEYMTHQKCENIKAIFGSTKEDRNDSQKGSAVFFDATLLAIPRQKTDGNSPYELVYSTKHVEDFVAKAKALGIDINIETLKKNLGVESKDFNDFNDLCSDDNLPIIARNCLENGESTNLWYEQVLPSKSVLATIIEGPEELDNALNEKIVQIGANATIGYGYCKFIKL